MPDTETSDHGHENQGSPGDETIPATPAAGSASPSVQLTDQHFQQLFSSLGNINARLLNFATVHATVF
jgi:hypothetical protein